MKITESVRTVISWSASIASQALSALTLLSVLFAGASTPSAEASPTQLTREQIAIIYVLLRDSGSTEEPSLPSPNAAADYYASNVQTQVVEAICLGCHVTNGFASSSDLIFSPGAENQNLEAIRSYLQLRNDDGETLLTKVTGGLSHGGGAQLSVESDGYEALAELVSLLVAEGDSSGSTSENLFFKEVLLTDAKETLRRAALILAGRLPLESELTLAASGEEGLRLAVLGLMQDEGFHDFLIRSANDRLHTDAFVNGSFSEVSDLNGLAGDRYPMGETLWELEGAIWGYRTGIARAPLELIAYVIENDRPYSEVLTADYTMVNWFTSQVFRSDVEVGSFGDPKIFAPGQNRGSVAYDDQYFSESVPGFGTRVLEHSGFIDYPHAGVLNDLTWLHRYPTTETNRNRARARWTFYHFLGIDIETSAPRTTDPVALADTDNPTLKNPACTVCHDRLDPVAGAYQNYGNEGFYRDKWGGLDSLPDTYKYPEWFDIAEPTLYREGDTWFRDMKPPGIDNAVQPSDRVDDSLSWLAEQMVNDSRFAIAAVKFWWPALMGAKALVPPEVETDADYQARRNAYRAQELQISTLASRFRSNNLNARELLTDMILSPWFRAKAATLGASDRSVELADLGVDRLLTPEELDAKNEAILGYKWDKWEDDWLGNVKGFNTALHDRFRLYYGGIDSIGIKERNRQLTSLMANVAERQALSLACGVTALDFHDNETLSDRRLFTMVEASTTPLSEKALSVDVTTGAYPDRGSHDIDLPLSAGTKEFSIRFNNDAYDEGTENDRNLYIDAVEIYRDNQLVTVIEGEDFQNTPGFSQTIYGDGTAMGGVEYVDLDGLWTPVAWNLWGTGYVSFHVNAATAGNYRFRIIAWGSDYGDDIPANMTATVGATDAADQTVGSQAIKAQIQHFHQLMLGETVSRSDPEVEAVYQLLLETWQERKTHTENSHAWSSPSEECLFPRDIHQSDWESGLGLDPEQMIYAWTSVMHYYLTHFDYLHE